MREDVRVPERTVEQFVEFGAEEFVHRAKSSMLNGSDVTWKQSGDVEVVDPEEWNVEGSVVERHRYVCRHDEGTSGTVRRILVLIPFFLAHLFRSHTSHVCFP